MTINKANPDDAAIRATSPDGVSDAEEIVDLFDLAQESNKWDDAAAVFGLGLDESEEEDHFFSGEGLGMPEELEQVDQVCSKRYLGPQGGLPQVVAPSPEALLAAVREHLSDERIEQIVREEARKIIRDYINEKVGIVLVEIAEKAVAEELQKIRRVR